MREYKKTYVIEGNPVPKALSKIRNGEQRIFYDAQTKLRRENVIQLVDQRGDDKALAGPVSIEVVYHMEMGFGIKQNFYDFDYQRPDLNRCNRYLFDLLKPAGIISNVAQICVEMTQKIYGENPRTEFSIEVLQWRRKKS